MQIWTLFALLLYLKAIILYDVSPQMHFQTHKKLYFICGLLQWHVTDKFVIIIWAITKWAQCTNYYFFTLPFCIFACIQYELNVVASDSLHETSTRVVIHVRDVNDLPPVFDQGTYIANTVEEYAAPKRRILKVESCCVFPAVVVVVVVMVFVVADQNKPSSTQV